MENYPGNSHGAKQETTEKKKLDPIVQGEVTRRKKPLGRRFLETFINSDGEGVANYIIHSVLIPAAKDTISDVVTQGIERVLFGESRSRINSGLRRGGSSSGYVAYNRIQSATRQEPDRREISQRSRRMHNFEEILLDSRGEGEEALSIMYDQLSRYNVVSVGDLYDLLRIQKTPQDEKWGWASLQGAQVVKVSGGWLLDIPRPEPID